MGKILVAEDDKFQQMIVQTLLKGGGHEVVTADDGEQAVSKYLATKDFSLILMDLSMPKLDGLKAAEQLMAKGCNCKIIGVSADSSEDQLDECIEVGMYSVLKKPIKLEMLAGYI